MVAKVGVGDFPANGIGTGAVGSFVIGVNLFNPFGINDEVDIFGLRTVLVALLTEEFCNCVTGSGDCENEGLTTVVVTGLCPLDLITEAGGLGEV